LHQDTRWPTECGMENSVSCQDLESLNIPNITTKDGSLGSWTRLRRRYGPDGIDSLSDGPF
jgi:hypothetical protein